MKPMHILVVAGAIMISPASSHAQVAGTTLLGVTVTELQEVAKGWSYPAKADELDKTSSACDP